MSEPDLVDVLAALESLKVQVLDLEEASAPRQAPLLEAIDGLRDLVLSLAGPGGRSIARTDAAGRFDEVFDGVLGSHPELALLRRTVARVADGDVPVLILGESGTGKELVARVIHRLSPRAGGPLSTVNCSAIPAGLLESELFGHTRGAFTGAEVERKGLFEAAHGGTVFLDEVGDMEPSLQARLLRVLSTGEVQKVGSDRTSRVDVRVLAATHRDLAAEVESGRFRLDLFYRLTVVVLSLPPLRERRDEIDGLVEHFLGRFLGAEGRRSLLGLTPAARAWLAAHDFPGNVRQLENMIRRAVLLAPGPAIDVEDLAGGHREPSIPRTAREDPVVPGSKAELEATRSALRDDVERRFLVRLLGAHGGRVSDAARASGYTRSQFQQMMSRLGIRSADFRPGPGGEVGSGRTRR